MAHPVFGIFGSFPQFSDFQLFSGLSTTDETLVVEMRIWCIKIGNVFALHCITSIGMGTRPFATDINARENLNSRRNPFK
jgi:hypothetical protein